jgi:asparagine synthase (glutamine-hydrolysing)
LVLPEIWNAARLFDPIEYVTARAAGDIPLATREGRDLTSDRQYSWTSRAELGTYTLNQLLRDTDALSMAHSLEVRVPLLDHQLVEKIVSLPDSRKRNDRSGTASEPHKPLLHHAVRDLLPAAVRERRGKQGFTFPFARWLRGDLNRYFAQYPTDGGGALEPRAVARVTDAFERGDMHWSRVWSLLILRAWLGERRA